MTDFSRNVHCVMGLPIDAISMDDAVHRLQQARLSRVKCFFSTPNLNFLVASQTNADFRASVCMSNLSLPDGMPLVWMAKVLNIPITERVSGSDVFDRLRRQTECLWRVFFFGGPMGVGQTACLAIGDQKTGVVPTGYIYPGFVSTQEMCRSDLLHSINESSPDMVVVSLGAAKGQDWICRNHQNIDAPVIAHLGAVINFVAGTVKRAPLWMQRSGLEWVWRAKEEGALIKRYLRDGIAFMHLLATRVLPLAWHQHQHQASEKNLKQASVKIQRLERQNRVYLDGDWNITNLQPVRDVFAQMDRSNCDVVLDMLRTKSIDSAFIGLLLLLEQSLSSRQLSLRLTGTSKEVRKYLRLSGVQHIATQ